MALRSPTEQSSTDGIMTRLWRALRPVLLDPTIIRWAHPLIAISLIFAQIGGGGRIAAPVLGGVAILVVLVTILQLQLHTGDPKTYDSPHLVQPLVSLLLIVALALLSEPLSLFTLIGVVVFEVWVEVVSDLRRLIPAFILPPLRWFLPFFSTFALLASVRTLEPMGVVLVAFLLPLWMTVLPEPHPWET